MSPDIFSSQSTETPWEWVRKRRKVFTSPIKDFLGALVPAIITGVFRYQAGDPGLRIALIVSSIAVGSAFALPQLETLYWRIRRRDILLDERERKLAEREAAPRVPPPPVPSAATDSSQRAAPSGGHVRLRCDRMGAASGYKCRSWSRLLGDDSALWPDSRRGGGPTGRR